MKPILYHSILWFLHHSGPLELIWPFRKLWRLAYNLEPARWHLYQRIFADDPATVAAVVLELEGAGVCSENIRLIAPFANPDAAWDIEIFCTGPELDWLGPTPEQPF